jgi:hypothetical protein
MKDKASLAPKDLGWLEKKFSREQSWTTKVWFQLVHTVCAPTQQCQIIKDFTDTVPEDSGLQSNIMQSWKKFWATPANETKMGDSFFPCYRIEAPEWTKILNSTS